MSFKELEDQKSDSYKKNASLEDLLGSINSDLKILNKRTSNNVECKSLPKIFIVGVPRSGTTLLSQWLAATNLFSYPSNFISRFYEAPYFGALIQEMLFNSNYDYKNELSLKINDISFGSDVGKTKGALEPHEFWYFWRRFFQFPDVPVSNKEFLKNAHFDSFVSDLNKFSGVLNKPVFLKSLIINPYISTFNKNVENGLFIYIKRDPIANMASLLKIRKKYYGDESYWFSFKPRNYDTMLSQSAEEQVAGQVYYINKEIEKELDNVDSKNKLSISYEDFCEDPAVFYYKITDKLNNLGYAVDEDYFLGNDFIDRKVMREHKNEELIKVWESVRINEA